MTFLAIDFETSDSRTRTPTAFGFALVDEVKGKIVTNGGWLFESRHSLCWDPERLAGLSCVEAIQPRTLEDRLPTMLGLFAKARFVACHSAYDRDVLYRCCDRYGFDYPAGPWVDTVQVARRTWGLKSAGLADVCRHLDIDIGTHHNPVCDAKACAEIVLASLRRKR